MDEKDTKKLVDILGKTHLSDFDNYCKENKESMNTDEASFSVYIKELLKEKERICGNCFTIQRICDRLEMCW